MIAGGNTNDTHNGNVVAVFPTANEEERTSGASLSSFFLLCHLPAGGNTHADEVENCVVFISTTTHTQTYFNCSLPKDSTILPAHHTQERWEENNGKLIGMSVHVCG